MKKIKKQIQLFYDEQAKKFSGTRQKPRPEFPIICATIEKYRKGKETPLHILELGCGDGRLYQYLKENLPIPFVYEGVDFSSGLLTLAKKNNPNGCFICEDMENYIAKPKQESVDIVISVASFQHIMEKEKRQWIIKNIHRILRYRGIHISINWCYSDRFRKKFKKQRIFGWIKWFFSGGIADKNNLLLPFTTEKNIYQRPYHIYTHHEISVLSRQAGLIVSEFFFVTKEGDKTNIGKKARNSFCIQQKDIFSPLTEKHLSLKD